MNALEAICQWTQLGNTRWQVNVVPSVLTIVGIGLVGYPLFKGVKNEYK